jgi:NAD(P)-dependent dehydrogenase (short-subunit alcohol dehydrogenase family)
VTVNAVCPGPTDTPRWVSIKQSYARLYSVDEADAERAILSDVPLGRLAAANDVARAVAFLASTDAGHISGHALVVDGGQLRG